MAERHAHERADLDGPLDAVVEGPGEATCRRERLDPGDHRASLACGADYPPNALMYFGLGEPKPVTSSQPGPAARLESWLNVRTL